MPTDSYASNVFDWAIISPKEVKMDAKCRGRDSGTHKVNATLFSHLDSFCYGIGRCFNYVFVFQINFKVSQRLNEGYKCVSFQGWSLNMD